MRAAPVTLCLLSATLFGMVAGGAAKADSAKPGAVKLSTGIDADANLPYWELSDAGASIRLVQRLPDQTRAFFEARGFSKKHSEIIAQSCVFQTILRNISDQSRPGVMRYNLNAWTVHSDGKRQSMKMREPWDTQWAELNVAQASRIAFEWALLPSEQTYQPGDYIWGMSIFNLPPGKRFDLRLSWEQYGEIHAYTIPGIECAPDIHPDPAAASIL